VKSVKHFTSWLGLSPQPEKTGGKVIHTKTRKLIIEPIFCPTGSVAGDSKVRLVILPPHANLIWSAESSCGDTKLARIVYHMLKYQVFTPQFPEQEMLSIGNAYSTTSTTGASTRSHCRV